MQQNTPVSTGRLQIEVRGDHAVGKTILLAWLGTWLERMMHDRDFNVPIRVINRAGNWPVLIQKAMEETVNTFDFGDLAEIVLVDMDNAFDTIPDAFRVGYQGPLHPPEGYGEGDTDLSPEGLAMKYASVKEHPRYPRRFWKQQVTDDITASGYWEWVSAQLIGE